MFNQLGLSRTISNVSAEGILMGMCTMGSFFIFLLLSLVGSRNCGLILLDSRQESNGLSMKFHAL